MRINWSCYYIEKDVPRFFGQSTSVWTNKRTHCVFFVFFEVFPCRWQKVTPFNPHFFAFPFSFSHSNFEHFLVFSFSDVRFCSLSFLSFFFFFVLFYPLTVRCRWPFNELGLSRTQQKKWLNSNALERVHTATDDHRMVTVHFLFSLAVAAQ